MAIFTLKDEDAQGVKGRRGFSDEALKKRHQRALEGFRASASFFSEQRRREMEDLKFVDFDEQWDPTTKTQRAGNQAVNGLPPTPPRPMITINQLRGPVQQLANTRRAAELGLAFSPRGAGSTPEIAEVYEDIARALQAESRAAIARNWAADRAEKAGMGWYRIDTEYAQENPTDEASWNDQDIAWHRILNQASVYPDPFAQEPDFSDGRRWYVTEDLPFEVYKERFSESDLANWDNSELVGVGDPLKPWIFSASEGDDGEASHTVRIAECWEMVEEEKTLVMLTDGTAAYEDDIPKGKAVATGPQARRRKKTTKCLYWSLMNGVEYLEEPREVNGTMAPLIPCIGEESNVDGERRWRGIVRPGKESAVSYNVMRSAQIEAIATASKTPWIAYSRVIGKFMEWWKQGPTRNFPFLPIEEAYDRSGALLPAPSRNMGEPNAIQAITIATAAAKDDVHTTTGVPPVALGQLDPHERSGKAIAALQGQAEVGSSGYMDNFVTITLAYEGKVVRDLIRHIYDRPGRIVPALGKDNKRRLVMLNAPYIDGPDGVPQMVPGWKPGMPIPKELPGQPDPQNPQQPPLPIPVTYLDMVGGEYSVAPTAGKSFPTKRLEASAAIGDLLQHLPPEMAMAITPAWIESQDWPEAKQIAAIAKNALPPPLKAAYEDDEPGQLPAPVKAQMQQMQQQIQQLTQVIQTKQAEVQAKGAIDLQKTQLQEQHEDARTAQTNQLSLTKAELAASTTLGVAQAKVDAENFRSYVDAIETKLSHALDLHMAHLNGAVEHMQVNHEAQQNQLQRTHEMVQALVSHQHAMQQADQGHQQALEQGQQAAALAPQPDQGAENA